MAWLQIVRMVLWGLFGIRSSAGSAADLQAFRPAQFLAVALVILAVLLALLLTAVRLAVTYLGQ